MLKIKNLSSVPEHLEKLAEWHHEEWNYLNPSGTLENHIKNMHKHLSDDPVPKTFVALDTELIGSASIISSDMDTKPELSPWLASVYVSPEYRHMGVGAKLVSRIVEYACSINVENLYLFTPDMEPFYLKIGWVTFENTVFRGTQVVIMRVQPK